MGFRPYVHRLAREHGLGGWVLNDSHGVLLEVEGDPEAVQRFLSLLPRAAPPLARVESVVHGARPLRGDREFLIVESTGGTDPIALVPPDAATCEECLRELTDPHDRRFRHPFINCTNCGPRFTIVLRIPYDRLHTTMARFAMCERCAAEYADPADRRFHAQANACLDCGPRVALRNRHGAPAPVGDARDAIQAAARLLAAGRILAVKGIGGYHLACRADSEGAVAALRARKSREDKPFAVMAADLREARELTELSLDDESLVLAPERPIVIAPRRAGSRLAPGVAPGTDELGVMLAYSPLHHLLLGDAGAPLIMTSGNRSDEPIAHEEADAMNRLGDIADFVLTHDRLIHVRTDDSVVRAMGGGRRPVVLRRSRGHVPAPLRLPVSARRPLLGCGGDLKAAFCLARAGRAWVGPHIGDLAELRTLQSYAAGIAHFEALFGVSPELVAHDLHPDYRSTAYALARDGVASMAVQHHHAHLAACLAEHGEVGPAVGAIYDGTGYGSDATVWGGEILAGGLHDFERAGNLWPVRMPGGEQAARQPWRMACAWLVASLGETPPLPAALVGRVGETRWRAAAELAQSGLASPVTSSAGRLFDAVAALCGIRADTSYEGQAAVELEAACSRSDGRAYDLPVVAGPGGLWILDARIAIAEVAADVGAGLPVGEVSARFHNGLAEATARAVQEVARERGIGTAVLSGGVFQNRRLLEGTEARLTSAGLRVLVPERLPPGDGGLAYGQAAIAAARDAASLT